jgi:hypothetical protein
MSQLEIGKTDFLSEIVISAGARMLTAYKRAYLRVSQWLLFLSLRSPFGTKPISPAQVNLVFSMPVTRQPR